MRNSEFILYKTTFTTPTWCIGRNDTLLRINGQVFYNNTHNLVHSYGISIMTCRQPVLEDCIKIGTFKTQEELTGLLVEYLI